MGTKPLRQFSDLEGETVAPHADGLAWSKACPECAFRLHDPQDLGDGYQRELRAFNGLTAFYCIHREDAGCNRICASYAAINRIPRTGHEAR